MSAVEVVVGKKSFLRGCIPLLLIFIQSASGDKMTERECLTVCNNFGSMSGNVLTSDAVKKFLSSYMETIAGWTQQEKEENSDFDRKMA